METTKENSAENTTKKSAIVPNNGVPLLPFVKSEGTKVTGTRSLSFDGDKQRNAKNLEKGMSKPGAVDFNTLRRAAQSVHIARICITVLKEKITKTKWIIKSIDPQKEANPEQVKEVEALFKHPNKNNETFRTLLDKMLEDLLVLDAVSLEKTRFPDGKLAELHFVDSATIRPVYDEHGNQDVVIPLATVEGQKELPVSYVQIADNSTYGGPESGEIVAAWPKKDFIHFHMHPQGSMENFGYGMSPLESVLSVVTNILNADNYNGTYFEEGAFPPVILALTGQMTQEELEAAREYLYSELTHGSFHRPAIMAGQKPEIINLKDLNNRDMQFMEYMGFLAKLMAAAYGLSPQDIGLTDDVNRATSETMKDLSEAKGYGSILHLIKEVFNQEIIWKDFGYEDLEFEWVSDDRTDQKDITLIVDSALKNGTMTINEARSKMGLLPYEGEWADRPMLLSGAGQYVPLAPEEGDVTDEDGMVGNEKPYNEQENIKKSVMTMSGYKTWYDDRGYSQPFIYMEAISGKGQVIKPPVAVNLMSQQLEVEITAELAQRGLNVPQVIKRAYSEVLEGLQAMPEVSLEFSNYINMTSAYDSEKWRARQGGSRLFPYYLVSDYIDGFTLNNKLLLEDMERSPETYRQAIQDLADLWKAEKELKLGDRRANQYIITPQKRAFGFDYQFKGNEKRYEDHANAIADTLKDYPDVAKMFAEAIKEKDGVVKRIIKALKKSAPVQQAVAEPANEFKNSPVMFGELVSDETLRSLVKRLFATRNTIELANASFVELSYNYDYNQAISGLAEYVKTNPNSYGGLVTSQDERGVKYTIYIKK